MKTIIQIKEEISKTNRCTNIPYCLKDEIWKWMKKEFKGKDIQIGNMMNSKVYGYCATVGCRGIEVYVTPKDYELLLLAI